MNSVFKILLSAISWLALFTALACTQPNQTSNSKSQTANSKVESFRLTRAQKMALFSIGTYAYRSMQVSQKRWGVYPKRVIFDKKPSSESGLMNLMSEPKIEGESVRVEVLESGESGKLLLIWREARVEVLQSGEIKIASDRSQTHK